MTKTRRIPTITENIAAPHMLQHSLHLGQRMNADIGVVESHHAGITSKIFKHHNMLHQSHHKIRR